MTRVAERTTPLADPQGDPTTIRAAARELRRVAARGLASGGLDTSASGELGLVWQGEAAARARADLDVLSERTRQVLPQLGHAADGLDRYAAALERAAAQTDSLRRRVDEALSGHAHRVATARATAVDPTTYAASVALAGRDRDTALTSVHRTRGAVLDDLSAAANQCARRLEALTSEVSHRKNGLDLGGSASSASGPAGCAPDVRASFIGDLGFVQERIDVAARPRIGHLEPREQRQWWQDAVEHVGGVATWTYNHTAVPAVNGFADVGQAVAEHPEDLLEIAFGVGGIIVGTGGEIGGTALDATGVGLVVGVPLNVAAAAVAAGGVGAVAHGATSLGEHARANDNRWLTEADAPTVGRGKAGDPLPDSARPDLAGSNWKGRVADSEKGEVWQDPDSMDVPAGAPENANSVRFMDPNPDYPHGYLVFYNKDGQPMNAAGKPGPRSQTHLAVLGDGTIPIPEGWSP
ncbi:hypothetical protein [Terrabacter terrigena]|uniref:WXG100 family type VII secretion target n=1 Tax=Terrabacter terrigena TaxID=574718 RepID=A0ABW3MSN6_9MICO